MRAKETDGYPDSHQLCRRKPHTRMLVAPRAQNPDTGADFVFQFTWLSRLSLRDKPLLSYDQALPVSILKHQAKSQGRCAGSCNSAGIAIERPRAESSFHGSGLG
jgi:hypothetical protein